MQIIEFTFNSSNSVTYPKPITALIIKPDVINSYTGFMLFTHGWGGNRFQHKDAMEWTVSRHNLIAISVEFRQSGYDFDSVRGMGADLPYDAGFYQVLDVLNGLRYVLQQYESANQRRIYQYGGSQGGQIALLAAIYAPVTFSWVYVSCPLTHLEGNLLKATGRCLAPHELFIRSPLELAHRIPCPVYLEYGTADEIVAHNLHGLPLSKILHVDGRLAQCIEYKGAMHDLTPTTTKLAAFKSMNELLDWNAETTTANDFEQGSEVIISCNRHSLVINWAKCPEDASLIEWKK